LTSFFTKVLTAISDGVVFIKKFIKGLFDMIIWLIRPVFVWLWNQLQKVWVRAFAFIGLIYSTAKSWLDKASLLLDKLEPAIFDGGSFSSVVPDSAHWVFYVGIEYGAFDTLLSVVLASVGAISVMFLLKVSYSALFVVINVIRGSGA
jgi:hypothetical protein